MSGVRGYCDLMERNFATWLFVVAPPVSSELTALWLCVRVRLRWSPAQKSWARSCNYHYCTDSSLRCTAAARYRSPLRTGSPAVHQWCLPLLVLPNTSKMKYDDIVETIVHRVHARYIKLQVDKNESNDTLSKLGKLKFHLTSKGFSLKVLSSMCCTI